MKKGLFPKKSLVPKTFWLRKCWVKNVIKKNGEKIRKNVGLRILVLKWSVTINVGIQKDMTQKSFIQKNLLQKKNWFVKILFYNLFTRTLCCRNKCRKPLESSNFCEHSLRTKFSLLGNEEVFSKATPFLPPTQTD